jgi:hypothetical protein
VGAVPNPDLSQRSRVACPANGRGRHRLRARRTVSFGSRTRPGRNA